MAQAASCFELNLTSNIFADGDTTPDVSAGSRYETTNTTPTVIIGFDGGADGQVICVTLDANSSIAQNSGIDTAFSGPGLVAYVLDGGVWRFIP